MEFGRWIILFLLNLTLFFSWFGVLNKRKYSISSRLLMAFVLSTAQIIVTTFTLGLPWAKLTAINLVILNVCLSGSLLVLAITRLDMLSALRELKDATIDVYTLVHTGSVLKILAILTVFAVIWIIFLAVLYPPIEWDALMYHLPAVGHYMQQQSLADPALPMDAFSKYGIDGSAWINSFPKNIEILFLWATIIPGTDILVDMVELVFGLIGVIAVYSLASKLGVGRKWAISAGLIFFLTPIVLAQSRSNTIDLSNSALILVALALLYSSSGRRQPGAVIVAGIAVGIVVGAKWSGLLFLPLFLIILVGQRLFWNARDQLSRFHKLAYESAIFLGPAVLFGSYWYLKNWYLYSNPLWPFKISFLGLKIFSGPLTQEAVLARTFPEQLQGMNMLHKLWVTWQEFIIFGYDSDMKLGGLGIFWFVFGLPAIFYALHWIIKRRDLAQAMIFIVPLAMLLLHPENWWTRYTMFIAGLGAIAFAKIRSGEHRLEVARLIDLSLVGMMIYSTVASFSTSYYQPQKIVALMNGRPDKNTSASLRPEIVSQAYDHVIKQTAGKPANVAYGAGLDFTYPLWGPGLQNHVYFLDPDGAASWIAKLRDKHIKYLLVRTEGPEQKYIKKSSLFNRTFFDQRQGYEVYKFRG